MTVNLAGASSACTWEHINSEAMAQQVNRLQKRIAQAIKEGKHGKAKSLQ